MSKSVKIVKFGLWSAFTAICGTVLIATSAYLYLSPGLPSVDSLRDVRLQTPLRIYTDDNKLIAEFGEKRRSPINIEDTPQDMINAFLAAEDDKFYSHSGVYIPGLMRAALQLVSTGRIKSGGSTITMQVARNFFLTQEQVFSRKFNEILLALEIERKLTKDEIIELYLNKIYLGKRAYGVEAAAQVYYGKSVEELDLAQIAMIAGLPKAPSRYNPLANTQRSLIRRNWILGRMLELEMIDQDRYQNAVNAPVTATYHGLQIDLKAPYVAEMVRQQVIDKFGISAYSDGYEVHTTINSKQQLAANEAIDHGVQAYDERHGYRGPEQKIPDPELWQQTLKKVQVVGNLRAAIVTEVTDEQATLLFKDGSTGILNLNSVKWAKPYIDVNRQGPTPKKVTDVVSTGDLVRVRNENDTSWRLSQIPEAQAALVALRPKDGAITAIVGGFNFYGSKYNRVVQASRQVGSAFKPFIYSAAINKGDTAATVINDAPLVFKDEQLESHWRPQNDNQKFNGPTRLRQGLYRSRNLVSIRLLQRTGINYTLDFLEKLGLPREKLPDNLSMSLGSAALTPLELATGYTVLANGGFKVAPYIIKSITRLDETIEEAKPLIACRACQPEKEPAPAAEQQNENLDLNPLSEDLDLNPLNLSSSFGTLPPEAVPSEQLAPRVMDKRVNYIIYNMMKDVIQKGTGRRARVLRRSDLAGKTGTTNDQRDTWFSGFNPEIQVTTWLGFDKPSPLGRWEYGSNAALPMWIDFMKVALQDIPESNLPQPENMVTMRINPKTGKPARPGDTDAIFEIFRTENAPQAEHQDTATGSDQQDSFNAGDIF